MLQPVPWPDRRSSTSAAKNLAAMEVARTLAAGAVSGGMIHEFANLLTVIDGYRQMADLGMAASKSMAMIEGPATRGQLLVESFRHFFSGVPESGLRCSAESELELLENVLSLRMRGRGTAIERIVQPAGLQLGAPDASWARLALLCGVLSVLERLRAGDAAPSRLVFTARGREGRCEGITATLDGLLPTPRGLGGTGTTKALRDAAQTLARSSDGAVRFEDGEREAAVILQLPA